MPVALGDVVKINYTGRLPNGRVFDSTDEPLAFVVGRGDVMEGIDEAVVGMSPGESRKIAIPPDKGYGEHNVALVKTVARNRLPDGVVPEAGNFLRLPTASGEMLAKILEVSSSTVTLDGNHPFAGQELSFDIELVAITNVQ